jgi:hypothetical protein
MMQVNQFNGQIFPRKPEPSSILFCQEYLGLPTKEAAFEYDLSPTTSLDES